MGTKLTVIIPVFNERQTIEAVIKRVENCDCGLSKEIIVVDDGSTDGTGEILRRYATKHRIIFHKRNLGKGAAIKTALPYANGDYIVIQDADLEYNPNDWKRMIDLFGDPQAMAVYGSRNLRKGQRGYPMYALGGRFLTLVMNLLFRSRLTDINTCYKMFRRRVFDKILLASDGFEFCEEVTAKMLKLGLLIREVPISYDPRSFREGKKIGPKDGFIGLLTIIRYWIFS